MDLVPNAADFLTKYILGSYCYIDNNRTIYKLYKKNTLDLRKLSLNLRWLFRGDPVFNDRSKAEILVIVLLIVALWFILRGDSLRKHTCIILTPLNPTFI